MTPAGHRTAVSRHLVLATGIGSQKPNRPQMKNAHLYNGITIHSADYKNAEQLKGQGQDQEVKVNVRGVSPPNLEANWSNSSRHLMLTATIRT